MEWISIKDFSRDNTFEVNKHYFLFDNDGKLKVNGKQIQLSPEVAMYKGGGKFISNCLEVLLIEDFTHIIPFLPPKE